jgi:hypothetical protein
MHSLATAKRVSSCYTRQCNENLLIILFLTYFFIFL